MIFQMKRNDTSPGLARTLYRADGSVVDLTGATVRFLAEDMEGDIKINAPAIIFGNPTEGRVRYAWKPEDTDTAGQFNAEFEVRFLDGGLESFPNKGFLKLIFDPDVD